MVIITTNNNRHCYCSVHCYYSAHKTSQSRLLKLYVQCESIMSWNKFYDVDGKNKEEDSGTILRLPKKYLYVWQTNLSWCHFQWTLQYYYNTTITSLLPINHSCHVDAQNTRMCGIKTIYPDVTSNDRYTILAFCQSILLAMVMLKLARWFKPKINTNTILQAITVESW